MPKLVIQLQSQEWTVELKEGSNVVGRSATCAVPVKDPSLSREHCDIVILGPMATLLDKGSMNGTIVNGKRVYEHKLQPGDKIAMGQTSIWYEIKKASAATTTESPVEKPTRRAAAAPTAVPDYSAWGRVPPPWGRIAAGVGVAAILAVAAWSARGLLSGGTGTVDDPGNLVEQDPSFQLAAAGGKPFGWTLRGKPASTVSVDKAQGRTGGASLRIEKSAAPTDLIVECGYDKEFSMDGVGSVEVTVHTRFDGFSGWAAIKIDWLASRGGPPVAEEFSAPVSKCADWTVLQGSFARPAGVSAFRVALAVIGRAGRVWFDDVAVRVGPASAAPREHKLGIHRVTATREGVLNVGMRGLESLRNLHVRLESDKEGVAPQSFSRDVELAVETDLLGFKGKMYNPVDLREVGFKQRVAHREGGTEVFYGFRSGDLRQVDRVSIVFLVPRTESIHGLPASPDGGTGRVTFQYPDADLVVEYENSARVRLDRVKSWLRVTQSFAVDPVSTEPEFGFRLTEAPPGSVDADPVKRASIAKQQGRPGEALDILVEHLKKLRDLAKREEVEREIRDLQERERRDWADVQARAFQAWISRRAEQVNRAQQAIDVYQQSWPAKENVAKSEEFRETFKKDLATGDADPESERPQRILERARKFAEAGRNSLAREMLQILISRFASSGTAPQARELLKSLSETD